MNATILAQFKAGIRLLQGLTSETVTIAGTPYPCTPADSVSGSSEFVQGGRIIDTRISVEVMKDDLPIQPNVDTLCSFRGQNFRVISADDAITYWYLTLIQPTE